MRPLFSLAVGLVLTTFAAGQDVAPRFEILHNPDLYKQETPQETLTSVIIAVGRERYDYLAAHLLDPAFVDVRLAISQTYFERVSGQQIVATAAGAALRAADLDLRVREVATRANFQNLTGQIGRKIADEPDNVRDLKRFAREAKFQVAGDSAIATIKDVKDKGSISRRSRIAGSWRTGKKKRPPRHRP